MAKIKFTTQTNEVFELEANSGSLMELAVKHNVPGIDADCGGVCSCATCHVHVDTSYLDKLDPASEIEKDLLEFEENVTENSRLSCQIQISEDLDGLSITVAN